MEATKMPYRPYKKGDLVWAARPNTPDQGIFSGLDTLRIYKIESFEEPVAPDENGYITLENRPGKVWAGYVNPATENNFKYFGTIDETEKIYFQRYLRWLQEDKDFGND